MKYTNTNHIKIRDLSDKEVNNFYYSCLNVKMNLNYNGGIHQQFNGMMSLMDGMNSKAIKEAKMLIYHMAVAYKRECRGFVVCLNKDIYNNNKGNTWSCTYRNTTNLIESLVYNGYGTLYRGDSKKEGLVRFKSVFVLSNKLLDLLSSKRKDLFPSESTESGNPSVIVKDVDVNPRGIRKVKGNVDKISQFLTYFDFNFNGYGIYPKLTRIFERTLKSYGRFYFSAQTIKSIYRKDFTIDGEIVTELDYSSNHARICSELAGVSLNSNFKPYNVVDKSLVPEVPEGRYAREVYKAGLMCLLNCDGGVHIALKNLWDDKLKGFGGKENCAAIIRGLKENNKEYINEIKKQDASSLQYIDSCIMENIMLSLLESNIPFLPYHDSVVVPLSHREVTKGIMHDAWKGVLGSDSCCVVDIKY